MTDQDQNVTPTEIDDAPDAPIVATFQANITLRGDKSVTAPTLDILNRAIADMLADITGGTVRVRSQRT